MLKTFLVSGLILLSNNPDEITCLAKNMYFEARNQSFAGMLAVANVTINRVKDKRFPNTICNVVKQGPTRASWKGTGKLIPIRNKCQFSWYCDGKPDTPANKKVYESIYHLAFLILHDRMPYLDITDGATHYHADYINPSWVSSKVRTVEIEDHIFYRWE